MKKEDPSNPKSKKPHLLPAGLSWYPDTQVLKKVIQKQNLKGRVRRKFI